MNVIQRILVVVAVLHSVQAEVAVPLRQFQLQNNLASRNAINLTPDQFRQLGQSQGSYQLGNQGSFQFGPSAIGTGLYGEIGVDRSYYNGYAQIPNANTNYGYNTQANVPVWNSIAVPAQFATQNPSNGIIIQTGPHGELIISYLANSNPLTSASGNEQQNTPPSDVNIQGQLTTNANAGNQNSKNDLPNITQSSKQNGNNDSLDNRPNSSQQGKGKQDQPAVILLDQQTIRKSEQTASPDEQTVRDSLPIDPPDQQTVEKSKTESFPDEQTRSASLKLSQLSPTTSARGPINMHSRFGQNNVEMQSTLQQLGSGVGGLMGASAGGAIGGGAGGVVGGTGLGIVGGAVGGLAGGTIGGLVGGPIGSAIGGTIGGAAGGGIGGALGGGVGGSAGGAFLAPIGGKVGSVLGAGLGAGVGATMDEFSKDIGPIMSLLGGGGNNNGAYRQG